MAKPFVIGDPVHKYLRVAAHERVVIDHPITQRLRRITQTGLVELVFPEARTSRFVHSLGAMHLASRFVISSLENASLSDARNFFAQIQDAFVDDYSCTDDEREKLLEENDGSSTGGLATSKVLFRDEELQKDRRIRGWLAVVEAAVRLAALFHDLGHLPFSHDFEFAFKAYIQEQNKSGAQVPKELNQLATTAPHETIGHKLADVVFRSLIKDHNSNPAVRTAYRLAKRILDVEPNYGTTAAPKVTALEWLHTLIDGDIDVDRADYLLRDGRALGLDFAAYNLDQLTRNLVLVCDSRLGFLTAVDERGLSALESYCLARARSNQAIIRHHKNAQVGAAFRFASTEALKSDLAKNFLKELCEVTSDHIEVSQADRLLRNFAKYDDPWWLGILRECTSNDHSLLRAARDLVLERKQTLYSIWKRKGELTEGQRTSINSLWELSREKPAQFEGLVRRLREEKNVLLAIHSFKPYSVLSDGENSQMMVQTENRLVPASTLSPLIRSLREAWDEDVHVHAFALRGSQMGPGDLIKAITTLVPQAGIAKPSKKKARTVTVVTKSTKSPSQKRKRIG